MQVTLYLLLGLGLFGGVFYALSQIAGRQRRLHAELTRLEQLTAEVAMTAEAMLDKIDERIEKMNRVAARVEANLATHLQASEQPTAVPSGVVAAPAPAQVPGQPGPRKRGRPRKNPLPPEQAASSATVAAPPAPSTPVQPPAAKDVAPAQTEPLPASTAVFSQPATTPADMTQRSAKVQAVFKMAAEGRSVPEIATLLAIPRGEVQLILNLRKVTA